jgi:hypothetical protein
MKQHNKDIYLIDPSVLENLLRQPPINPSTFLEGIKSQSIKGSIVLTRSELLDLMQESIEHSHPVLTRDAAEKLLSSKL